MPSLQTLEQEKRLRLLTLSDSFSEDEDGEQVFTFIRGPLRLVLLRNEYDGDTSVLLSHNECVEPILKFEIKGCKSFEIKEEGQTVYLEMVAVSALDYRTRGTYRADTGLLIAVRPFIQVCPFFRSESADSSDQRLPGILSSND